MMLPKLIQLNGIACRIISENLSRPKVHLSGRNIYPIFDAAFISLALF